VFCVQVAKEDEWQVVQSLAAPLSAWAMPAFALLADDEVNCEPWQILQSLATLAVGHFRLRRPDPDPD
jgi:hypothetical protein